MTFLAIHSCSCNFLTLATNPYEIIASWKEAYTFWSARIFSVSTLILRDIELVPHDNLQQPRHASGESKRTVLNLGTKGMIKMRLSAYHFLIGACNKCRHFDSSYICGINETCGSSRRVGNTWFPFDCHTDLFESLQTSVVKRKSNWNDEVSSNHAECLPSSRFPMRRSLIICILDELSKTHGYHVVLYTCRIIRLPGDDGIYSSYEWPDVGLRVVFHAAEHFGSYIASCAINFAEHDFVHVYGYTKVGDYCAVSRIEQDVAWFNVTVYKLRQVYECQTR